MGDDGSYTLWPEVVLMVNKPFPRLKRKGHRWPCIHTQRALPCWQAHWQNMLKFTTWSDVFFFLMNFIHSDLFHKLWSNTLSAAIVTSQFFFSSILSAHLLSVLHHSGLAWLLPLWSKTKWKIMKGIFQSLFSVITDWIIERIVKNKQMWCFQKKKRVGIISWWRTPWLSLDHKVRWKVLAFF